MFRLILIITLCHFTVLFAQIDENELYELLDDIIDTDVSGLQYLVETFPYGEIDFNNLQSGDLEKLFFLSPDSREIIWREKEGFKNGPGFDDLNLSQTEIKLLKLCQKEYHWHINGRLYSRVAATEEQYRGIRDSKWRGDAFASWQKFYLKYGPLKFGLSVQKDPGEQHINDAKNGFASYTNAFSTIGFGSFLPNFATGLLLSSPRFSSYKYLGTTPFNKTVRGYAGSDENWTMFGLYGEIRQDRFTFNMAFGRQFLDGRLNDNLWSLNTSGYHRTENELSGIDQISVDNYYFSSMYDLSGLTVGSIVYKVKSNKPFQTQNVLFETAELYNSLFWRIPQLRLYGEFKTYPGFSFNMTERFDLQKLVMEINTYYYDDQPAPNSRHILYNRLPVNSKGMNIKWRGRAVKNRIMLSGYANYEERYIEGKNYFYCGLDIRRKTDFTHHFGLQYSRIFDLNAINTNFNGYYQLQKNIRKSGMITLRLHVGFSQEDIPKSSRFFVIRFRECITPRLQLVADFAAWTTDEGMQVWFYQDGLPEAFSIFSTSGDGATWILRLDYNLSPAHLYYAVSKQNRWGETSTGSGDTEISGPYKSVHQVGVVLEF